MIAMFGRSKLGSSSSRAASLLRSNSSLLHHSSTPQTDSDNTSHMSNNHKTETITTINQYFFVPGTLLPYTARNIESNESQSLSSPFDNTTATPSSLRHHKRHLSQTIASTNSSYSSIDSAEHHHLLERPPKRAKIQHITPTALHIHHGNASAATGSSLAHSPISRRSGALNLNNGAEHYVVEDESGNEAGDEIDLGITASNNTAPVVSAEQTGSETDNVNDAAIPGLRKRIFFPGQMDGAADARPTKRTKAGTTSAKAAPKSTSQTTTRATRQGPSRLGSSRGTQPRAKYAGGKQKAPVEYASSNKDSSRSTQSRTRYGGGKKREPADKIFWGSPISPDVQPATYGGVKQKDPGEGIFWGSPISPVTRPARYGGGKRKDPADDVSWGSPASDDSQPRRYGGGEKKASVEYVSGGPVTSRDTRTGMKFSGGKKKALMSLPEQETDDGTKRSLRSRDTPKARSDLATYIPNFDELMSFESVTHEEFSAATIVVVVDDLTKSDINAVIPATTNKHTAEPEPAKPSILTNLHNAKRIDLHAIAAESNAARTFKEDPLPDDYYERVHSRHQRREKRFRNIEKEQAQHDRGNLERLHDELCGGEWLRTLGVTSVADSDRQLYANKREIMINEVKILLDKFKLWREGEKRLREERALKEAMEAIPSIETDDTTDTAADFYSETEARPKKRERKGAKSARSKANALDATDVDELAARQLEEEAAHDSTSKTTTAAGKARGTGGERAKKAPGQQKITSWMSSKATTSGKGKRKRDDTPDEDESADENDDSDNAEDEKAATRGSTKAKKLKRNLKSTTKTSKQHGRNIGKPCKQDSIASASNAIPTEAPAPIVPRRPVKPADADLNNLSPDPEARPAWYTLPGSLITADAIKASERRRRAARRDRAASKKA